MYSEFFLYAVKKSLGDEGVFSNVKADRGGKTKYGITERIFLEALSKGIVSGVSRIEDLTIPQATEIYHKMFWLPMHLDNVRDRIVAAEIFDTGINTGPGTGIRIAQKAVNYLAGPILSVDGAMGIKTLSEINRWAVKDAEAFFKALNGFQFIHYEAIVRNDPTQLENSRGWMKRIQEYHEEQKRA